MVDLAGLYLGIKRLPASVGWIERDSENLVLVSPVEIDGVVVEGLRFRLTAMRSMPEEAVTCQLEYHERRRVGGPFCRIDWRPIHRHDNRAIGPPELRHRRFTGSHHHEFNVNWTYAAAMVRRGNLPIVIPFDNEPQSFSELIAFLEKELRIERLMSSVPRPPWQAGLF